MMVNNDMKKTVLANMNLTLRTLRQQMDVVDALDNDSSSSGFLDLHDQLHTMTKTMDAFDAVVARAALVVPDDSDNVFIDHRFDPVRIYPVAGGGVRLKTVPHE
jgi:hypothetical protein